MSCMHSTLEIYKITTIIIMAKLNWGKIQLYDELWIIQKLSEVCKFEDEVKLVTLYFSLYFIGINIEYIISKTIFSGNFSSGKDIFESFLDANVWIFKEPIFSLMISLSNTFDQA